MLLLEGRTDYSMRSGPDPVVASRLSVGNCGFQKFGAFVLRLSRFAKEREANARPNIGAKFHIFVVCTEHTSNKHDMGVGLQMGVGISEDPRPSASVSAEVVLPRCFGGFRHLRGPAMGSATCIEPSRA